MNVLVIIPMRQSKKTLDFYVQPKHCKIKQENIKFLSKTHQEPVKEKENKMKSNERETRNLTGWDFLL